VARWLCAALCVITVGTISSQSPDQFPFSDAGPSASPRLSQLKAALKSPGREAALETFWADIRRGGAPLIEAVPGEPNYSWVTFLWFATRGERYPLLVVLDAGAYADYVPVPKILDTLIAEKRIQPIVAVLVGNAARAQELTCSPAYADFLATELVPWMRAGAVDAPVCGRRKEGAAHLDECRRHGDPRAARHESALS
jgi:hypothetical protein